MPHAWPRHFERVTDTTRCANCGEPVGHSYKRVFADGDQLQHCAECRSRTIRYGTSDVLVNDSAWEKFLDAYRDG